MNPQGLISMKKEKTFRNISIFILAQVFLVFMLSFLGQPKIYALSIEDETLMGQQFVREVLRYYELVDDEFSNQYFRELGSYLSSFTTAKPFPLNFYIIKSTDLNAFAGPGGHIFVFTGFIIAMENVDEVAAVLCHEMGHVTARHVSERMDRSKKINLATMAGILAGALIGGDVAGAMIYGSMAAGAQAQLSYSRDDERQADQLENKYMVKTGFDPRAMLSALQKLQGGLYGATNTVPVYLRTHPAGPERMSNLESMLTHYTPGLINEQVIRFRKDFALVQTILRAECLDPLYAKKMFTRNLEKNPGSSLDHLGLGIVWKKRAEYSSAVKHLEKALEKIPNPLPVLNHLGEAYQLMGEDRKAIEVFDQALKIDHSNITALYLQAISFQNIKDYDRSIQRLERLIRMKPLKDKVFYDLGVSYGRQNELGPAHYNFGIYFMKKRNIKDARYHFEKALEESKDNPLLIEKIDKGLKVLNKIPEKPPVN